MTSDRRFVATTAVVGLAALLHAVLTWPLEATIVLFAGGVILAFLGEILVVQRGWLEHHTGTQVAGVPLYVLPGWTGVIYVTVRIALLAAEGWIVVPIAATLATAYDVLADNHGVEDGHWTYTDGLPGPRHRNVPWWNYAGWFAISAGTTAGPSRSSEGTSAGGTGRVRDVHAEPRGRTGLDHHSVGASNRQPFSSTTSPAQPLPPVREQLDSMTIVTERRSTRIGQP